MTTRPMTLLLVMVAGLLTACTAGKKLKQAEAQNSELQTHNSELQAQNNQLQQTVNSLKQDVSNLSANNKKMADEYANYRTVCESNAKKMEAYNAVLQEEADRMEELEKKLEEALAKFEEKGIDVYEKDGIIHVDMKDALLYKVGSAKLSPDGETALANLASVLNEFPKLKVIVVGNTDTAHVKGVADNWSLSTERANGVVRVLMKNNIDPARLTAAGKSKFNPVADNSTKEGKAKNRRTEIVLNPDWERLWNSAKKE